MSAFHTRPPEAAVLLPCELKDHRTFDRISLEANEAKALNMHRPEKVIVQTTLRTLTRKQKQRSVKPHLLRKKKKTFGRAGLWPSCAGQLSGEFSWLNCVKQLSAVRL